MTEDFDFDVSGISRQQINLAADMIAAAYWGDQPFKITHINAEAAYGSFEARVYTRAVEPKTPPPMAGCPTVVMPESGQMQILAHKGRWLNIVVDPDHFSNWVME